MWYESEEPGAPCIEGYERYIDPTTKAYGYTLDKDGNVLVLSDIEFIVWTLDSMGLTEEEIYKLLAPYEGEYPHAFLDLESDIHPWLDAESVAKLCKLES